MTVSNKQQRLIEAVLQPMGFYQERPFAASALLRRVLLLVT
jgi:hypothetical protein